MEQCGTKITAIEWNLFDSSGPNEYKKKNRRYDWCPLSFDLQSMALWFPDAYGISDEELWGYCGPGIGTSNENP